jgi:endonuclease/exonuclease/phosphatase (EEP) superfamily protein YafD
MLSPAFCSRRMRSRHFARWALRLGLGFSLGCSSPERPPRAPGPSASQFSLASFNLYFPAADDAETLETVGETGADVIFVQEVSPRWEAVLRQRYAQAYPYMLFAAKGGASGLGVLSRVPVDSAGWLPAVFKHPAWLIRVHFPAANLLVLNVHLRASTRPGQGLLPGLFSMSADHAVEIRSFLDQCPSEPSLVVGDFNEGPGGAAVEWLKTQRFVDSLQRYRPGEPTFRALAGLFRSALDHVLFRGCVDALDARVLRSGNSDHWPLLTRFEIRAGATCG